MLHSEYTLYRCSLFFWLLSVWPKSPPQRHAHAHTHRGCSFLPSVRLPDSLPRQPLTSLEHLCFYVFASLHSSQKEYSSKAQIEWRHLLLEAPGRMCLQSPLCRLLELIRYFVLMDCVGSRLSPDRSKETYSVLVWILPSPPPPIITDSCVKWSRGRG